jgi:hypothetical protein
MLHDEMFCLSPHVQLSQGGEKAKIYVQQQLHMPNNIEWNGAPQGSHIGPTEHDHIRLVTHPAKGMHQPMDLPNRQFGHCVLVMCVLWAWHINTWQPSGMMGH